jgi:hypothetical protein
MAMAFRWREELEKGKTSSIEAIAKRAGCTERYVRKMLPLAFLAPNIVESILDGRQPPSLTTSELINPKLPLCWAEQRRLLGFVEA